MGASSLLAQRPSLPPIRFILVGDSTVAPRNGWGDGFCADLIPEVTCLNLAKNGRSSSSYRAEGSWDKVMELLKGNSDFFATYVLIQFGHNDQPGKPGRSTDLTTEFPVNMRHYVDEVRAAGGKPILVTPLTRRIFKDGKVNDDLEPWAAATRKAAALARVPVLDLHTESLALVEKMGAVGSNVFAVAQPTPEVVAKEESGTSPPLPKSPSAVEPKGAPTPVFDYTHLGEVGCREFGRMVILELAGVVPDLGPYMRLGAF